MSADAINKEGLAIKTKPVVKIQPIILFLRKHRLEAVLLVGTRG